VNIIFVSEQFGNFNFDFIDIARMLLAIFGGCFKDIFGTDSENEFMRFFK